MIISDKILLFFHYRKDVGKKYKDFVNNVVDI